MKNLLCTVILFSLLLNTSYSQIIFKNYKQVSNKLDCEITLSSLPHQNIKSGNETLVSFNGFRDESSPGKPALPTRSFIVALPSYSKVTVTLTPVKVIKFKGKPALNPSVTADKDGDVVYDNHPVSSGYNMPQNLVRVKGYLWVRNYYCVNLEIVQYQANNNIIEELQNAKLSFTLQTPEKIKTVNISESKDEKEFLSNSIINYNTARQLDKKYFEPAAVNDSWIDFSKTYLKIGTFRDGIYRITKADLDKFQVSTSAIPLNTYRLISKGQEIPIYSKGNNNILDDAGYIEFFGRRNMGANYRIANDPGTPYNEYLDRYSDTTIYWLTWGGTSGMITPILPVYSAAPVDTVKYYAEIVHYEKNYWWDYSIDNLVSRQYPQYKQNQTWVWGQQQVGTSVYPFTVSDVFPGKTSKAFYKVQDFAANTDVPVNSHKVGLSINSDPTVYDSAYFNKNAQRVVSAQFSSNLLVEGNNNLNAISFPTKAPLNSIEYDWYEVEYPRYLKAANDSLKFVVNDQAGEYLRSFKITNLTNRNIVLYKYSPQILKILNFFGTGGEIDFSDSVSPGDKYYLVNESKISSPVYYYIKNFSDIVAPNIQADYILITHPLLIPTANQYASFISQNYSLNTRVINVFDIYDQFNYGYLAPEPIKDFLIAANQNWQAPKPTYLFLVGDANYDYYSNKVTYFGTPPVMNFVPSFGEPVSDSWFTMWDTSGSLIPQMYLGRLPASSVAEFQHFFDKHRKYLSTPFDDWNKYYLLFSGGNDDKDGNEIAFMKSINDAVSGILSTPPTGGIPHHLYKTYNPRTNFGPYTEDQINYMIGLGGVFISYIGHSGTQTWDNGINDVNQLKNSRGKIPFITDFGCSTGKFAEPDIRAFSELFVDGLDGEAIGYVGNATLGFTSTTSVYPQLFYTRILKQNLTTLGKAHVFAKIDLISNYGAGGVNAVFMYGNTLFTDPVIKLAVPPKPDLNISQKDITIDHNFIDDSIDSATVQINYFNYGMVFTNPAFKILVTQSINGVPTNHFQFTRNLPLFMDSILIKIPIKGNVGTHTIEVTLDSDNLVDELSKSNNTASFTFNVASNSVRTLVNEPINNISGGSFYFINPINKSVSDSIYFQVSPYPDFSSSNNYYKMLDTAYTKISIPSLHQGTRYWFRSKISNPAELFGSTISFIYDSASTNSYYLGDSLSFANSNNSSVDIGNKGISLGRLKKELVVISAGAFAGSFAIVSVNKNNYLSESQLAGIDVAVFSDTSLAFEKTKRFNFYEYSSPARFATDMYNYLDSIQVNKIVCFANSGNAGIGLSDSLITMIHSFGSKFIDSVTFDPYSFSWAMIGRKGAPQGSVFEKWNKPNEGPVSLDSVFSFESQTGFVATNQIGPVSKWSDLKINYTAPNGASVSVVPVGIKSDGTRDTLAALNISGGTADLSLINASVYNYISLITTLAKGNNTPPSVNNIKVEYKSIPEIGTNFQVFKLSKDTVTIGENITLSFKVLNEGLTEADSIKVRIDRVKPDNSRETVSENIIDKLLPGSNKNYSIVYNTSSGAGTGSFVVSIDPDNKIKEFYKDNNLYTIPFYVKGDTSRPSLAITIDGTDILDGDFVSSNPKIIMQLNDQTLLPITDPASVSVTLNDSTITTGLNYHFNNANPKVVVDYNPKLPDGDYILNIKGKNALGTITDSLGLSRHFRVNREAQLMDVYNYPNPFAKETFFTFKLTQIPDELKIRIFTVTGRLIKEIVKKSYELSYDFNRIHWDGKDQDGNFPANGVYFYKMVMKKGNITQNVIQKLAIIK